MHIRSIHLSLRGRLWAGFLFLGLLVFALIGSNLIEYFGAASPRHDLGLDFVAFYRAGALVHEGRADRLYDVQSTRDFDRELAAREQLPIGDKYGLFFNPPFFAWLYAPLAVMGYQTALLVWTLFSIICFAASAWLLVRMIASDNCRDWLLVPALLFTSLPLLQTLGHAQNTFLSLLIATTAVSAWRGGWAFAAGVVAGLLFYKPQLAAAIVVGMAIHLGWRALAGAAVTGITLMAINVISLPGTLIDYLHRIGPNVQYMMATHPYIWARHVTIRAFWEMLLDQWNPTASPLSSASLAVGCTMILGVALLLYLWRNRSIDSRDRSIAAIISSAPLLMPYYVDYDLLLLAIPAVLLAAEMLDRNPTQVLPMRDRWLIRLWVGLYIALIFNPAFTLATHFNLVVPLLSSIATISIVRIRPERAVLLATPMFDDQMVGLRAASMPRALAS